MEFGKAFLWTLQFQIERVIPFILSGVIPFTLLSYIMSRKKQISCLVFGIYLSSLFSLTLFSREIGSYANSFEFELLWSYKKALIEGNRGLGIEILLNYLLFLPFGMLLPVVFYNKKRVISAVSCALCTSACIELIQGITRIGLFEFDDILNNTMGAVIGWGIYTVCQWIGTSFLEGKQRYE